MTTYRKGPSNMYSNQRKRPYFTRNIEILKPGLISCSSWVTLNEASNPSEPPYSKEKVDHGPSLTGESWELKGITALDARKLYGNLYLRSSKSSQWTGTKNKDNTVKSHQVKWIPPVRLCFTLNLRPSSFEGLWNSFFYKMRRIINIVLAHFSALFLLCKWSWQCDLDSQIFYAIGWFYEDQKVWESLLYATTKIVILIIPQN